MFTTLNTTATSANHVGTNPGSIEKKHYAEDGHQDRCQDRRKDRGPIVRLNVPANPSRPTSGYSAKCWTCSVNIAPAEKIATNVYVRKKIMSDPSMMRSPASRSPLPPFPRSGVCPRVEIQREPDPPTKLTL
jgi:hypothetical protein